MIQVIPGKPIKQDEDRGWTAGMSSSRRRSSGGSKVCTQQGLRAARGLEARLAGARGLTEDSVHSQYTAVPQASVSSSRPHKTTDQAT